MEGNQNHRGRALSGPHTYAGRDAAQNERVRVCGILEGEKQLYDT